MRSFAVILALLLPQAAFATSTRLKLAVLDVKVTNIDPAQASLFTEILTTELAGLENLDVMSSKDVQAILTNEVQKQVAGCSEETCLAEIGGALGAERLVAADIGKLEASYVVNVKLINVAQIKTERRVYLKVEGTLDDVTGTLRAAVYRLFELSPPADVALYAPGSGFSTEVFCLLGAGVVALGVGGYYGNQAKTHFANATDHHFNGAQLEVEPGESAQTRANLAFVGGALLVLGGASLWVWQNRDEFFDYHPAVEITFVPTAGGGAVALQGGF